MHYYLEVNHLHFYNWNYNLIAISYIKKVTINKPLISLPKKNKNKPLIFLLKKITYIELISVTKTNLIIKTIKIMHFLLLKYTVLSNNC
jgi:hypothetical protein